MKPLVSPVVTSSHRGPRAPLHQPVTSPLLKMTCRHLLSVTLVSILSLFLTKSALSQLPNRPADPAVLLPPEDRTHFYPQFTLVVGQETLGSEDPRKGAMFSLNLARPEPRLTLWGNKAQLVTGAYLMTTRGGGWEGIPIEQLYTVGVTLAARYHNSWIRGLDTFIDFGWGISHSSFRTRDLDRHINSTPFLAFGAVIPYMGTEWIVRAEWFHMSNAGTGGNNQGFNSINYSFGVRF